MGAHLAQKERKQDGSALIYMDFELLSFLATVGSYKKWENTEAHKVGGPEVQRR